MLAKWCEVTSCNGIIDLYEARSQKWRFIFWITLMIIMLVLGVFFTYKAVMGYIDTPLVTKVDTVPDANMDLPEILVCYNGGLNVTALQKFKLSNVLISALSAGGNFGPNISNEDREKAKGELSDFMKKHNFTFKDIYDIFGYQCEDMVESLRSEFLESSTCKRRNPKRFLTTRGPCYLFQNLSFQWYPGNRDGVQLKLKAPNSSFANKFPSDAFDINLSNDFTLSIEKSITHLSFRNILIPINSNVQITLNPMYYKHTEGSSKCNNTIDTSSSCFFDCWRLAVQLCHECIPLDQSTYDLNATVCNEMEWNNDDVVKVQNVSKICGSSCLPKCNEWIFETVLAYSPLDSSLSERKMSSVMIFYNVMQYTQIAEEPSFTYDVAVANVGGQFGLWLGASVVTIIQAFYYFMLHIYKKSTKSMSTRKQVENVSSSAK